MTHLMYILVAKTDQKNRTDAYLPLYAHMRDTAEVMHYLVDEWLPESVCKAVGLTRRTLECLAVFLAYVHDIGKATTGFQYKVINSVPYARQRIALVGIDTGTIEPPDPAQCAYSHHTITGAAILYKLMFEKFNGDSDELQWLWLPAVVGAHHGKTLPGTIDYSDILEMKSCFYGKKGKKTEAALWQEAWHEIMDCALSAGKYESVYDLPHNITKPAQMLLTGLVIMADWLASNTRLFPLIDSEITNIDGMYPQRGQRAIKKLDLPPVWTPSDEWKYCDLYSERFKFDRANAIQQSVCQVVSEAENPGLLILEAPMGMGKTEAALAAGEILAQRWGMGGLAFFLPSQATANCMFTRVCDWARQFAGQSEGWEEKWNALSTELAHGKAFLNDEFARLTEETHSVYDQADDYNKNQDNSAELTVHNFFTGHKTQLLADFVVGTVDQLLMGALKQKHIMLRHLGLAGKVVVIDEVHAYDAYMSRYLDSMLSWLGAYHTPVLLLSATLPGQRRADMVNAYTGQKSGDRVADERAYPLLTWTDGAQCNTRCIEINESQTDVKITRGGDEDIEAYLRKHMADGGCAGVIVNTVNRAQRIMRMLETAFPDCEIILDHAQFTASDRVRRDDKIVKRLGRTSAAKQRDRLIVVGTQVLEQSLDIDFDTLISDMCPMDLLLQRIGRLHRHADRVRPDGMRTAECLVLNTDCDALEPGAQAIYGQYLLMKTSYLLKDTVHLPGDISLLVQAAYDENVDETLEKGGNLSTACCKYNERMDCQREKANNSCIKNGSSKLGRKKTTCTINGLLQHKIEVNDKEELAAVRDGANSIEVIILGYDADGMLQTLSDDDSGLLVSPSAVPSKEEAQIILRQSLRLPHRFSSTYMINHVINELEDIRQTKLREWALSPILGQELFLLFDENGFAQLSGINLCYDSKYGLQYVEEVKSGQ